MQSALSIVELRKIKFFYAAKKFCFITPKFVSIIFIVMDEKLAVLIHENSGMLIEYS